MVIIGGMAANDPGCSIVTRVADTITATTTATTTTTTTRVRGPDTQHDRAEPILAPPFASTAERTTNVSGEPGMAAATHRHAVQQVARKRVCRVHSAQ
jgi:hypothetical protein